jgi:hypothetical protein
MKLCYSNWHKETIHDDAIQRELSNITKGELEFTNAPFVRAPRPNEGRNDRGNYQDFRKGRNPKFQQRSRPDRNEQQRPDRNERTDRPDRPDRGAPKNFNKKNRFK